MLHLFFVLACSGLTASVPSRVGGLGPVNVWATESNQDRERPPVEGVTAHNISLRILGSPQI